LAENDKAGDAEFACSIFDEREGDAVLAAPVFEEDVREEFLVEELAEGKGAGVPLVEGGEKPGSMDGWGVHG
jgi:hypothetical protein